MTRTIKDKKREYSDQKAYYRSDLEEYCVENTRKCKHRCAVRSYKKGPGIDYVVVVPSIILLAFTLGVVFYSYHNLSSVAPAALAPQPAKNSQAASASLVGNDISNWKTFNNGVFEIKYPNDWQLRQNETDILSLRKSETDASDVTRLNIEMNIGEIDNPDNLPLMEAISSKAMVGTEFSMPRDAGDSMKHSMTMVGGKNAMVMDHFMAGTHIYMQSDYWALDQQIYYLDAIFYDQDDAADKLLVSKMLGTFKFLD